MVRAARGTGAGRRLSPGVCERLNLRPASARRGRSETLPIPPSESPMTPEESNRLAALIVFLVVALIVAIPVLALSIRFAAKPFVESLAKLREVQGQSKASEGAMLLQDRRMNLLESELQHITATLDRLVEAERFHARLEAPAPGEAGALPSSPVETPRA